MTRVDVPTLKCDRCGHTTQSTSEMGGFVQLNRYHMGGTDKWDLCAACWKIFVLWLDASQVPPVR